MVLAGLGDEVGGGGREASAAAWNVSAPMTPLPFTRAITTSNAHTSNRHNTTTLVGNIAFYMDHLLGDWKVPLILGFSVNYHKCDDGCGRDAATGSFLAYSLERMNRSPSCSMDMIHHT